MFCVHGLINCVHGTGGAYNNESCTQVAISHNAHGWTIRLHLCVNNFFLDSTAIDYLPTPTTMIIGVRVSVGAGGGVRTLNVSCSVRTSTSNATPMGGISGGVFRLSFLPRSCCDFPPRRFYRASGLQRPTTYASWSSLFHPIAYLHTCSYAFVLVSVMHCMLIRVLACILVMLVVYGGSACCAFIM